MRKRAFLIPTLLAIFCVSQAAFAVVPPLSQSQREEAATDIVSGYVISVKKKEIEKSHGKKILYVVQMIVTDIEKGSNVLGGHTVTFHYWKNFMSDGWCGDSGQSSTIKHYEVIKAYLRFDELANRFNLLSPNGFDLVQR